MAEGGGRQGHNWDPTIDEPDSQPSMQAIKTIMSEIKVLKDGHWNSSVKTYFDEEDITKVHVLINGEPRTPYAGGFFYFLARFRPNYPQQPPKVKLMNTGGEQVQFNPNVYSTGKVCHSLLGTWEGASWDADNNLSDVLETITRMLNEKPYFNEPFLPFIRFPELREGDAERYNDVIRHETLRVAVCDMMAGTVDMPEAMRDEMTKRFKNNYHMYRDTCRKNGGLDGSPFQYFDPFSKSIRSHKCNYKKILSRLSRILKDLEADLKRRRKKGNRSKKGVK